MKDNRYIRELDKLEAEQGIEATEEEKENE